jgi:hypothetical protein
VAALNLWAKISILSTTKGAMLKPTRDIPNAPVQPSVRRRAIMDTAQDLGLLGGQTGRIGGRIRRNLVAPAKKKSGITSDTELLEYAQAKVALEDDFGTGLIRRKGRIAQDVDLEF